jgi:L-serine dehydratase
MRGPSSSHTAGPYFIGQLARSLLGQEPAAVTFTFDPGGSFAQVYRQQRSDLGFAAGVMGWDLVDARFPHVLQNAAGQGLAIRFGVLPLADADHPNTVEIEMVGRSGRQLSAQAQSTGGGSVLITRLDGWPAAIRGDVYDLLLLLEKRAAPALLPALSGHGVVAAHCRGESREFLHLEAKFPWPTNLGETLRTLPGVCDFWLTSPVFMVPRGEPIFDSAAEMVALAAERQVSLGRLALGYEATLLGMSAEEVLREALRRYRIMAASVKRGLTEPSPRLQLLEPSAAQVYRAEASGQVAIGGLATRAAARALAVMHVNAEGGLICAAPTAGAAGVLPAVLVTLAEERGLSEEGVALALLAAGAVGLIVANRATFAAEVAGCQVEIGAAGAMAAAAVIEAAGGTAGQAAAAAAISFQNTMGSVCDLVGGLVEIPCHTRNAAGASTAFLCADLVMGGYDNPIPLDETLDAVYAVGRMLPRELRCTALGGLAQTPTALTLSRRQGLESAQHLPT